MHYVHGLFLNQRARLLGGQNYVFVVGQDNDVFGVYFIDRKRDVLGARVHGLTAFDYSVHSQVLEYGRHSFAGTNGKYADILALRLVLGFQLAVLFQHIFYFYFVHLSQLQGVRKRRAGIVGVHVHLDKGQIAYDKRAVAYVVEFFAQLVDVADGSFLFKVYYKKLGAVGKLNIVEIFVIDLNILDQLVGAGRKIKGNGCGHIVFGALYFLVAVAFEHTLENHYYPVAAGVDHARLFQHVQHFRSLSKDFLPLFYKRAEEIVVGQRLFGNFQRVLGHNSDNRKHRAFLGLGYRAVSKLHSRFERPREILYVKLLLRRNHIGKALQYLRQNDARVASRAPQSSLGQILTKRLHGVGGVFADFLHCGNHCQRHIRARVAVGDGEHVESVYRFFIYFEHFTARNQHFSQHNRRNGFVRRQACCCHIYS